MRKSLAATITALAAALTLTGCAAAFADKPAGGSTPAGNSTSATQPVTEPNNAPANGADADDDQDEPKVLKVAQVPGLTPIVTSASGRTVYRFDNDSSNPSASTCFDECAELWEPVLAGSGVEIEGDGIDERQIDTIDRPEGEQVTLKGWPLYYFKDDVKLGELAGQGRDGLWFAVNPKGGKAKSTKQTETTAPVQKDVQTLTVNVVDGFMPFVTNQAGRTIYRFDNDSSNPSRTSCTGECTKKWEPVLAGKNGVKILSNKINRGSVGTIDRAEGKQLTLNGWPLYYFHKDKKLGQTAGYGVGNAWFAIAPDGKKAPRCP
jgi:predicted lipoprotein with Yx(FWY)xxD motif